MTIPPFFYLQKLILETTFIFALHFFPNVNRYHNSFKRNPLVFVGHAILRLLVHNQATASGVLNHFQSRKKTSFSASVA